MALHHKKHPQNLTLLAWNANGIRQKKDEFLHFFKQHACDIALINETFLKPGQTFKLPNTTIYRNDRPSHGGGTAVIVRRGISHHEITLPPLKSIEATAILIDTKTGPLRLIAAYKPPRSMLDTTDLDAIFQDNTPTVLAGDLNSKHSAWNSRITNPSGKILFSHSSRNDYLVMGPDSPTYFSDAGHRPDVLDIVLANNISCSINMSVIPELSSDHNPLLVNYGNELVNEPPPPKIDLRGVDWEKFQAHIEKTVDNNKEPSNKSEVDAYVSALTDLIVESIKKSKVKAQPMKVKPYHDLPANVIEAIRAKNKLRHEWQRKGNPHTKTRLNKMKIDVQTLLSKHTNETWSVKLKSLKTKDNSIWRMTKAILRIPQKVPPLHGQNGMAYSDQEKAESFADTLESAFFPNDDPSDIEHIEHVNRVTNTLLDHRTPVATETEVTLVTTKEIRDVALLLKNKKAPGFDFIPNQVLKKLPMAAFDHLSLIFNSMIKLRYFSIELKHSKIILFAKPGKDHAFPQNYRPISLLTGISKLFEKVILARIQSHINTNEILRNEQFGFRQGHSTDQQLVRLTEIITKGFNEKMHTGVVFLDIAQAFDKVWHKGLLYKMMEYKFPDYLTLIIKSYLSDRTFQVSHGTSLSTTRKIRAGVPQGSLLGPVLFNIFINDMPRTEKVELALYADDTALITQSRRGFLASNRLQAALDNLEEWYEKWRVKINVSKSNAVLFTKKIKKEHIRTTEVTLFEEVIPWQSEAKYLGVIMDRKLTWGSHVKAVQLKTKKRMGLLKPLIKRKSSLSIRNGLLLYKTLLLPIMSYACCAWGTTCNTNIQKLQTVQNVALRQITKSPWYVRNADIRRQTNIDLIKDRLRELATKFYQSLTKTKNPIILNLGNYDESERTKYVRPKAILANSVT